MACSKLENENSFLRNDLSELIIRFAFAFQSRSIIVNFRQPQLQPQLANYEIKTSSQTETRNQLLHVLFCSPDYFHHYTHPNIYYLKADQADQIIDSVNYNGCWRGSKLFWDKKKLWHLIDEDKTSRNFIIVRVSYRRGYYGRWQHGWSPIPAPLPPSLSLSLSLSLGCIPQLLLLASLTDFPNIQG